MLIYIILGLTGLLCFVGAFFFLSLTYAAGKADEAYMQALIKDVEERGNQDETI